MAVVVSDLTQTNHQQSCGEDSGGAICGRRFIIIPSILCYHSGDILILNTEKIEISKLNVAKKLSQVSTFLKFYSLEVKVSLFVSRWRNEAANVHN